MREGDSLLDEERIKKLIDELDGSVSKDGAAVQFNMYGGGHDESFIQANKQGYLRLGIEFLKAAYSSKVKAKEKENQNIIETDINYLTTNDSEIRFDWLELKEDLLPSVPPTELVGFKRTVVMIGCLSVLLICIAVFIIGIQTISHWFK